MSEMGFLQRGTFKIQFNDITELIFAAMIIMKIDDVGSSTPTSVRISCLDFFPQFRTLEKLVEEIEGKNSVLRDDNSEMVVDVLNFLFKGGLNANQREENVIDFYNKWFSTRLDILLSGDTMEFIPCIESYNVIRSGKLHDYDITVIPSKLILAQEKNIYESITLKEKLYETFKDAVDDIGMGISYRKQMEFAHSYLHERTNRTGELRFDFNLKEIQWRHLLARIEDDENQLITPMPLSTDAVDRLVLPFFMETIGHLDLTGFKIASRPDQLSDIEVVYSITIPSVKNRFQKEFAGLSIEQRKLLSETQLVIFERVYRKLSGGMAFLGRPKIEKNFVTLFFWLLKKVTYCLEEPSFLKEKSERWFTSNSQKGYLNMEDDFFLPFIHEKLVDEFGDSVPIIKKPEKFGGEIDILFQEIPVELKVRRNENENLSDIIDDSFRPASQAATYSAITRLGFVLVLDMPTNDKKITNLDSCFKTIVKEFNGMAFTTQIVTCIFHCNLPKPSAAK